MAKNLKEYLQDNDNKFAERAFKFWNIASIFHKMQDHKGLYQNGAIHCEEVDINIWNLIDKSRLIKAFKNEEFFLLTCCAACHDFDKAIGKLPKKLPQGKASAQYIYENLKTFGIDRQEANAIYNIVSIHNFCGDDFLKHINSERFDRHGIRGETYDLKRLALLLKVADIADTACNRLVESEKNYHNLSDQEELEKLKFAFRKSINDVQIYETEIRLNIYIRNEEDEKAYKRCFSYLKEYEWEPIKKYLRPYGFFQDLGVRINNVRDKTDKVLAKVVLKMVNTYSEYSEGLKYQEAPDDK